MDLATPSGDDSDEEWELCNDDGFIYKRKKRRLDPSEPLPPPPPVADPQAEEKYRRQRRKNTLLKIQGRYQRELALWEHLSNKCRAMQEKAEELRRERETEASSIDGSPEKVVPRKEGDVGLLIDKLLSQAEAQAAIIEDVSNLCDVAEALCQAQEEQFKQSLIDLPIWASPQELMAALSDG